jgi:hypothetical protein
MYRDTDKHGRFEPTENFKYICFKNKVAHEYAGKDEVLFDYDPTKYS